MRGGHDSGEGDEGAKRGGEFELHPERGGLQLWAEVPKRESSPRRMPIPARVA